MTTVAESLSADDVSHVSTLQVQGTNEQATQNNIMHFVMAPKREPVKIGNIWMLLIHLIMSLSVVYHC